MIIVVAIIIVIIVIAAIVIMVIIIVILSISIIILSIIILLIITIIIIIFIFNFNFVVVMTVIIIIIIIIMIMIMIMIIISSISKTISSLFVIVDFSHCTWKARGRGLMGIGRKIRICTKASCPMLSASLTRFPNGALSQFKSHEQDHVLQAAVAAVGFRQSCVNKLKGFRSTVRL